MGSNLTLTTLTWFEIEGSKRLRVQEVQGWTNSKQHVVVVPFVQDDKNQVANLKTGGRTNTSRNLTKKKKHRSLKLYYYTSILKA